MAFCIYCGKKLADGEICRCQTPHTETASPDSNQAPAADDSKQASAAATGDSSQASAAATGNSKYAPAAGNSSQALAAATDDSPQNAELTKTTKPKKKRRAKIIATLIAILIVAIAALLLTAKPYLKPVNDFMAQINKHNSNRVELIQTLMPDFGAKKLAKLYTKLKTSEDFSASAEDLEEIYQHYYENATDEYDQWKLTFKLKSANKLEDDEFEDIRDDIESYYEDKLSYNSAMYEDILEDKRQRENWADTMDVSNKEAKNILQAAVKYFDAYEKLEVTEVYEIRGRFIIKTADRKMESETVKFITAKVNGDWFYYSFLTDDLTFKGDTDHYFSFLSYFLLSGRLFFHVM